MSPAVAPPVFWEMMELSSVASLPAPLVAIPPPPPAELPSIVQLTSLAAALL
jgi:hypothetical protein